MQFLFGSRPVNLGERPYAHSKNRTCVRKRKTCRVEEEEHPRRNNKRDAPIHSNQRAIEGQSVKA